MAGIAKHTQSSKSSSPYDQSSNHEDGSSEVSHGLNSSESDPPPSRAYPESVYKSDAPDRFLAPDNDTDLFSKAHPLDVDHPEWLGGQSVFGAAIGFNDREVYIKIPDSKKVWSFVEMCSDTIYIWAAQ